MDDEQFVKDYLVSRVISFGKTIEGYGKIYYQTNEDLVVPYIDIDFCDKDILTVLASGDHVFTSRLLDAKKVDSFDCNRLAEYYFYLRVWSLEYRDTLYPKILDVEYSWLKELLNSVKPKNPSEKRALRFFKKHIIEHTNIRELFYDVDCQPKGRLLYRSASELDGCLDHNLSFLSLQLFKEFYFETTYDIVLISNILEWARNDPQKLKIAAENLARTTKKDGVVVCSELISRSEEEKKRERDIFSSSFFYEPTESGYVYIKKN